MTGWRLGYALGPADIIAAITKMHQYGIMSAPTTAQYAAIEAMETATGMWRKCARFTICAAASL